MPTPVAEYRGGRSLIEYRCSCGKIMIVRKQCQVGLPCSDCLFGKTNENKEIADSLRDYWNHLACGAEQ